MIKKLIIFLIIIAVLFGFYKITSKPPADLVIANGDYILFYGSTCPHCKVVEEYISQNQTNQKLKIDQLEIYENENNKNFFVKTIQQTCPDQLESNGISVPFLIDIKNKQCLLGDTPIINYLSEKIK